MEGLGLRWPGGEDLRWRGAIAGGGELCAV